MITVLKKIYTHLQGLHDSNFKAKAYNSCRDLRPGMDWQNIFGPGKLIRPAL